MSKQITEQISGKSVSCVWKKKISADKENDGFWNDQTSLRVSVLSNFNQLGFA